MNELKEKVKSNVESWVRREFKLDNDCFVFLSEVACDTVDSEKETLVMVLKDCSNSEMNLYRINKCLPDIDQSDVLNLLSKKSKFEVNIPKDCLQNLFRKLYS